MNSLLIIASTLFQGGWTMDVARNQRAKTAAFSCLQPRDDPRIRSLPEDVFRHLWLFMPIDDWSRLNLVFNLESPRLQPLKQMVKENRNEIRRNQSFEWAQWGDGRLVVDTDENGNIVRIAANRMGLKDEDILNLSRLPITLEVLDLYGNDLTKVDLRHTPRNLELLFLESNQLTEFNINNAPETLRRIRLGGNQLHRVDVSSLKGIPERNGLPMIVSLEDNPSDLEVISFPPIEDSQWTNPQYPRRPKICLLKVPTADPSNNNQVMIYKNPRR